MKLYRNDLKPDLVVTLTDGGTPINLTTATSVRVIGVKSGATLFNRTTTGTSAGVVTMPWEVGDTDEAGRIYVEVEVTWPGNKPQTFRPHEVVDIVADYA